MTREIHDAITPELSRLNDTVKRRKNEMHPFRNEPFDCIIFIVQLDNYRINKYILPYFGDSTIKDITAGMIRTWQNEKLIPNFQKNTSVELCRVLNSILSYGVKYYGLSVNPAKIAGSVRYPNTVKESVIKYWTQEQFERFMTYVKDDTYHLHRRGRRQGLSDGRRA